MIDEKDIKRYLVKKYPVLCPVCHKHIPPEDSDKVMYIRNRTTVKVIHKKCFKSEVK